MPVNEAATELSRVIALMDDPSFERWASNFGIFRLVNCPDVYLKDWKIQPPNESMSDFRTRFIETMAPEVATTMAADFIMAGYEIDIVSGDRVLPHD
jgi:hypothetical protein